MGRAGSIRSPTGARIESAQRSRTGRCPTTGLAGRGRPGPTAWRLGLLRMLHVSQVEPDAHPVRRGPKSGVGRAAAGNPCHRAASGWDTRNQRTSCSSCPPAWWRGTPCWRPTNDRTRSRLENRSGVSRGSASNSGSGCGLIRAESAWLRLPRRRSAIPVI